MIGKNGENSEKYFHLLKTNFRIEYKKKKNFKTNMDKLYVKIYKQLSFQLLLEKSQGNLKIDINISDLFLFLFKCSKDNKIIFCFTIAYRVLDFPIVWNKFIMETFGE